MAAPPDSNNPPGPQPDHDLTLNDATPASADVVADLSLNPEVNAPAAEQSPGVDIFVIESDESNRSWLSRLRALKSIWEKEHLRRRGQREPLPTEGIKHLDQQLDSLAALRDVCATIDRRLTRVEQANEREDGAPVDEALHAVCSQMSERLLQIEAAVQRTEQFLADSMLREICLSLEKQLVETRTAVQRAEEAVADKTLYELCRSIDAHLEHAEETVQKNGSAVAERLQTLSGQMAERFEAVEHTVQRQLMQVAASLQRTEAATDRTLQDFYRNIDTRLEQTEGTLQQNGNVLVEELQALSGRMVERFEAVEETLRLTPRSVTERMLPNIERQLMQARMSLQRTEEAVTDKTLLELCQNINARLERTEDRLHRSEGVVVEGLHDLSERMAARFAEAEETIQRIEGIVSSRMLEQMRLPQPSQQMDAPTLHADDDPDSQDVSRVNHSFRLPWTAGLVMPALVLLCALAVSSLITTDRPTTPQTDRPTTPQTAVPVATTAPAPAPLDAPDPSVVSAADAEVPVASAATVMANGPRSPRDTQISVSPPRSSNRVPQREVNTSTPARFVGTLSITSVPSGASVSINGKPAGKTPLRLPRQRAGSLAVQIAHDGFERWSAAVLVPADQLTQVTANLRASAR
jgi:hypothetical protein